MQNWASQTRISGQVIGKEVVHEQILGAKLWREAPFTQCKIEHYKPEFVNSLRKTCVIVST